MNTILASNIVERGPLPDVIEIRQHRIPVDDYFKVKQDFYMIRQSGETMGCSHISPVLGHLIKASELEELAPQNNEVIRALEALDKQISRFIKEDVLKAPSRRRGAMSFSQSHEAVPLNHIVMSKETFDLLCLDNPTWKNTSHVICIRYPNLGPHTTKVLKLVVDSHPIDSIGTVGERSNTLKTLLEEFGIEKKEKRFGSFFLNPQNLKDELQGDGDGDLVYIGKIKKGSPVFREIDWSFRDGELTEEMENLLFSKSSRTDRPPITEYLPTYFDTPLIGPVTYAIRKRLFDDAKKNQDAKQPMHQPWYNGIADWGIFKAEFSLDIRKGEFTSKEIESHFKEIMTWSRRIKEAKEAGCWFAKTVTSNSIEDVRGFVERFKTVKEYTDYVSGKPSNN